MCSLSYFLGFRAPNHTHPGDYILLVLVEQFVVCVLTTEYDNKIIAPRTVVIYFSGFLRNLFRTEGKNQTLVGAIPFCGEYPGPRFEDKFRSANQIDGISIADGGKMADS